MSLVLPVIVVLGTAALLWATAVGAASVRTRDLLGVAVSSVAVMLYGTMCMYLLRAARAEAVRKIADAAKLRAETRLAGQERLIDTLSVLSPATALQRTILECAGTSRGRYRDFLAQDAQFQDQLIAFFDPRKFALPDSVFRSEDYERIPRFQYREETTLAILKRLGWPCSILLAYGVVGFVIATVALRRFDSKPI